MEQRRAKPSPNFTLLTSKLNTLKRIHVCPTLARQVEHVYVDLKIDQHSAYVQKTEKDRVNEEEKNQTLTKFNEMKTKEIQDTYLAGLIHSMLVQRRRTKQIVENGTSRGKM
uniref:Uncharacterized protein n=1 Tax=Timema genevievae TaxID=629358 RepID=A0A7R9PGT0_TIMGE|nr:unnamed protein product [Timema genevievae]